MGLLQEIKNIDNLKIKEDKVVYYPKFMSPLKKNGFFYISDESLSYEIKDCFLKTNTYFSNWLEKNNLKISKKNNNDHYKISYK